MVIVTCEHAVNTVPAPFRGLFMEKSGLLDSHAGWDPGASELAGSISKLSGAPLYEGGVTRLLVDLNRSPDNRKGIFSCISRRLSPADKKEVVSRYYDPFRLKVEDIVRECVKRGEKVLHLSIHTFTPVMKGKSRKCDIGLLYDTARCAEKAFALELKGGILSRESGFVVRLNYPYQGKTDGHTAYMRRRFPQESYVGLEIEASQTLYFEGGGRWKRLKEIIAESVADAWGIFFDCRKKWN